MPRRGAKAPSAETRPTGDSVTVVSGSIRTADDPAALSVKLSVWDTEVTMRVDGVELGNWAVSDVGIRAIDSTSFEFVAEGDQLVFTPDDLAAFAASSLVKGRGSGGGRRNRRKSKKDEAAPPAVVVADSSSPAQDRRATRRTPEEPRPSKPSRRERKAAEREQAERVAAELTADASSSPAPRKATTVRQEAVPTPIGDVGVVSAAIVDGNTVTAAEPPGINIPAFSKPAPEPVAEQESVVVPAPAELLDPEPVEPPEPVELPAQELLGVPEKPLRQRKSLLRRTAREEVPDEALPDEPMSDEPEETGKDQPNRMWIRALDMARKYDFLGLDRVPVNESLRGQEHQHTWDHRVAPSSGPGKYICTICGEIRRAEG